MPVFNVQTPDGEIQQVPANSIEEITRYLEENGADVASYKITPVESQEPVKEPSKAAQYASEAGSIAAEISAPFTKLAYDYRDKLPTGLVPIAMGAGALADAASNAALFTPVAPAGAAAKAAGVAALNAPKAFTAAKNLITLGQPLAKNTGKAIANHGFHEIPIVGKLGSRKYADTALGKKLYEKSRGGYNITELEKDATKVQAEINTLINDIKPIKYNKGSEAEKAAFTTLLEKKQKELTEIKEALKFADKDMGMTKAGQAISTGLVGAQRYGAREFGEKGKDYAFNWLEGWGNRPQDKLTAQVDSIPFFNRGK